MNTKNFKIIAFDLDDTVLIDGKLTQSSRRALIEAHKKGYVLVVSTGRHHSVLPREITRLGIIDYYVLSNGALIMDAKAKRLVASKPMPREVVNEVLNSQYTGHMLLFFDKYMALDRRFLTNRKSDNKASPHFSRVISYLLRVKIVKNVIDFYQKHPQPVYKMISYCNSYEDFLTLKSKFESSAVEVVATTSNEAEFTAKGVNKGDGLREVARLCNVDYLEIISFGDSGNDVSMAQGCGCFVAMGQATEDVKAVASVITKPVGEGGFAYIVDKMLSGEEI